MQESLKQLATVDDLDAALRALKRGMLWWMLAMQAPVYTALVYLVMRVGA